MEKLGTQKFPFDYVVIGGNLTALLVAELIGRTGQSCAVIESSSQLGGHLSSFQLFDWPLSPHHGWIPNQPENLDCIKWLEKLFEQKIIQGTREIEQWTFNEGEFKKFVGFGETAFKSLDFLAPLNCNEVIDCESWVESWIRELQASSNFTSLLNSEVTFCESTENQILNLTLNGSKKVFASHFVCCTSPQKALGILGPERYPAKLAQKLSKAKAWSEALLYMIFPKDFEHKDGLHFLYSLKSENEPIIGRFFNIQNESSDQCIESIWRVLIDSEIAEDVDCLGQSIRHIRKQLKRAYPKIFDQKLGEKIVIQPGSIGHFQQNTTEISHVKGLENFILALPMQSDRLEPLNHIEMAMRMEKYLQIQLPLLSDCVTQKP